MVLAIFDAILIHIMNAVSPSAWHGIKMSLCVALNKKVKFYMCKRFLPLINRCASLSGLRLGFWEIQAQNGRITKVSV